MPSKRKTNNNKKNAKKGNMVAILHPKPIDMIPKGNVTMRYQNLVTTSAIYQFTVQNFLDTFVFAASATIGYQLLQSVRIKYIEVWGIAASGVLNTVSLRFDLNGNSGDCPIKTFSDTALGNAEPSHVKVVPPKNSAAAMWQVSSNENYFSVGCNNSTIIDICFDYTVMSSQAPIGVQNALIAAIPGTIYVRGLDGLPTATSQFPVVTGTFTAI
jgi:hypothetical protein